MKMAIMKKVVAVLSSAAMLFSTCINSSLAVIAETTSLDKLDFSVNSNRQPHPNVDSALKKR